MALILCWSAVPRADQIHGVSERGMTGSWSFVVLPDTQHYAERHPQIFEAQTRWIAEQRDIYDIRFVLHEGDVTNYNTEAEWAVARRAFDQLEGRVPYLIALGNHDIGSGLDGLPDHRQSLYSRFFPPSQIQREPSFGGGFMSGKLENSYRRFATPDGPWLAIALEFAPRTEVLAWADRVLRRHAQLPAVLLTHAYLNTDGSLDDVEHYAREAGIRHQGLNGGTAIWNNVVRQHDNVVMVLCGHNHGTVHRVDRTNNGYAVHQLLADYQDEPEGGGGFLRLLHIDTARHRVEVRTYSPHLGVAKIDPANHFNFPLPHHRSDSFSIARTSGDLSIDRPITTVRR